MVESDSKDHGAILEPPAKAPVRHLSEARKAGEVKKSRGIAEDATHHDIATDWLARQGDPAPVADRGSLWGYDGDAGLWKAIPPEKVRAEIGRRYLAKTCRRYGDY